jgi:hypothetical protein
MLSVYGMRSGVNIAAAFASLGLASVALMITAPAEAAAPLMRDSFTFTEPSTECGYDSVNTYSISNLLLDSNPSSGGQFFRFSYTWQTTSTVTNPSTDAYVTLSGHCVYKEIQPRSLGDGLFTYEELNVGTFVVSDSSGQVLLREEGTIAVTWQFDSLSDFAPGGTMLSPTLLRISGPHPTLTGDVDYCAVLDSAIG